MQQEFGHEYQIKQLHITRSDQLNLVQKHHSKNAQMMFRMPKFQNGETLMVYDVMARHDEFGHPLLAALNRSQ